MSLSLQCVCSFAWQKGFSRCDQLGTLRDITLDAVGESDIIIREIRVMGCEKDSSIASFEDGGRGPCAKEARKGKERDCPPELPKRRSPANTLILAQ